ncbi:hypothetical protein JCM6882_005979 [Rhodosporidiobolus microsporus]
MPDATPAWKRELEENGYAIVRGAVSPERAAHYTQATKDWASLFGWKEDDRTTWRAQSLPVGDAGLVNEYGVSHERWVWEARMEDKVVEVFEELWGTKELIVSFDAINFSLPVGPHARTDVEPTKPWPHIDQQPTPADRPPLQFELAQGLLAMTPSGPNDGGLVVLKRSHALVKQFFDETGVKAEQDWGTRNYYTFTDEDIKWFRQQPGVEEIKVETQPGDLILWDSRTIHWNRSPLEEQVRVVVYVCFAPKAMASEEVLRKRAECFKKRLATTHWPAPFVVVPRDEYGPPMRDGVEDPMNIKLSRPSHEPEQSKRLLQLVGTEPY